MKYFFEMNLSLGFRHIDSAANYGNEEEVWSWWLAREKSNLLCCVASNMFFLPGWTGDIFSNN